IRREVPTARVIIVSQNDPAIMRKRAHEVNAHAFVSKEEILDCLVSSIDDVCGVDTSLTPPSWMDALDGPIGELIRRKVWSSTPLGSAHSWSPTLRMMTRFLLANRFPQLLWWGPQFCCIYNDAYAPILGSKHPWALGRPTSEVWGEIWHVLKPLVERPYHG